MKTLKERIIQLLQEHSGLTDREITNRILGEKKPQQPVNQACRSLEAQGVLKRVKRQDGLIGNYLATDQHVVDYFQNKGKKDLEEDKKAFSDEAGWIPRSPHSGGETVLGGGALGLRVQHRRIPTKPFRWTGASSITERPQRRRVHL